MNLDPEMAKQMLQLLLSPWHEAVAKPAEAQEAVLQRMVPPPAQTRSAAWRTTGAPTPLDATRTISR